MAKNRNFWIHNEKRGRESVTARQKEEERTPSFDNHHGGGCQELLMDANTFEWMLTQSLKYRILVSLG